MIEGSEKRNLNFRIRMFVKSAVIQICFSAEATVSRVCEKTVYLFR